MDHETHEVYENKPSILIYTDVDPNSIDTENDADLENEDSEESYAPLYTYGQIVEIITFLTYSTMWLCVSTVANIVLGAIVLYKHTFMTEDNAYFMTAIILCDVIIIMDLFSTGAFMYYKNTAKKRYVRPRNKGLLYLDMATAIAIPTTLIPINDANIFGINLVMLGFRNYRLLRLLLVLSKTAGHNTFRFLAFKYGLISFVICHVYASIWISISCFEWDSDCSPGLSWTSSISGIREYNSSQQKMLNYISCMLYAINTYTTVGLFGASKQNDVEQFVTTTLMLVGLYVANGLFIGDFTSVQQEGYRRHAVFSYKLGLINDRLAVESIPKKLKKKMKDFYIIFWKKRAAIRTSKMFDKMLPNALRNRVLMDKYWDAMAASNLLRPTSMAFKRALSKHMFSEIYTTGEIIYTQDRVKNMLMYVARGSVQVLSGDDTESSLLTLRMGSCLGDISLIYSLDSQVQVVSSSYSIVYCLRKSDVWRAAHRHKLINPSETIHSVAKRKMRMAHIRQSYKARLSSIENFEQVDPDANNALGLAGRLISQADQVVSDRTIEQIYDAQANVKEDTFSNLYIISKEGLKLSDHDGIFIKTTFPWILRPSSQFTVGWELLFSLVVIIVCIWYPWILMKGTQHERVNFVFMALVCLMYTTDFVIRMFTAIEDDKGIYTNINELMALHCSKIVFMFDVFAVIPLEFIYDFPYLMLNRGLEIYRVICFIKKAENSFKVNVAVVRSVKYIVYLLYLSYFIGFIYFICACWGMTDGCQEDAWPEMYNRNHNMSTSDVFEASIMVAILLTSGTGGKILYQRLIEVLLLTLFCIIGTLVFSYLVSDYSATLTLAGMSQSIYVQMVEVIRNFMIDSGMPDNIQKRMNHYLEAQWLHNKGMAIGTLLKDAPPYLYEEYQTAKYGALFAKVPLFQELDDEVMIELTSNCNTLFFPPNEFVTYSREIVKEMYIVEKGFCEVISPASGRIEKVIGPGSVFSAIDMLLELPGVFHVRTVTHVALIKISLTSLHCALRAEEKAILNRLVEETKQSFTVQRLFTESTSRMIHKVVEVDDRSWVAPPRRTDPRRAEYLASWKMFRCCRYFIVPYTIMPCGKFLAYYEIFRAVCAFICAVLLPTSFIYAYYIPRFPIIHGLLDFFAVVDIYIRLHVCYYNAEGILVTHPRATSIHYITGSFVVDLVAVFPCDYFVTFFWRNNFETTSGYEKICAFLRLNRILQLYRVPDAFTIFTRDLMKSENTFILSVKFVILSLSLLNFVCGIFMICTNKLEYYSGPIVPEPASWITYVSYPSIDLTTPLNIYIVTYYFVCSQAIGIGYSDMFVSKRTEIILDIIIIISGYLWFTYVLVIISNNRSIVNINLTLYQKYMEQIISFMRRERLDKDLQRRAINHFEYVWKRSHGLRAATILEQCHLALSKDCALHLYEDTLKEVLIFRDMVMSFYRVIGTNLDEQYFLVDYPIIKLNDVVSDIYIIHKGRVEITGPDGTIFAILTRGGVFGNIDDVKATRSMVFAKAVTNVDLLVIDTKSLYSIINAYNVVVNRLRKYILLENLNWRTEPEIPSIWLIRTIHALLSTQHAHTQEHYENYLLLNFSAKLGAWGNMLLQVAFQSYIDNRSEEDGSSLDIGNDLSNVAVGDVQGALTGHMKILASSHLLLAFMISSLFSYGLTTYQASFKIYDYWFFGIVYFLDLVHIIKIYLGFFTPYIDNMGEIVVSRKKIRKSYLKFNKFFMELAASLPTDLLYFVFPNYGMNGLVLFRLNRILRLICVLNYYNIKHDQLNINVLLIKLSSIFIFFTLLIHTQGCGWNVLACPFGTCDAGSWVFENGTTVCQTPYVCSLYCATSMATYSGFSPPHATTMREIIYSTTLMIFNKFTLAVFIGYMTSIVHNINATLVGYDHGMEKLKEFLKHARTSEPLINRVLIYSSQLWDRSEGMQVPLYLTDCPGFLQEKIKIAAYGHHIYQHEVFMKCHPDFLRLLIRLLRVTTLFDQNMVCQQGDVNDTMFFVHLGSIKVYTVSENDEVFIDELQELDSFGIVQGIVPCTPHTHTFVACGVTVIVSLILSDWHHLLTFFPASKFMIFDQVNTMWSGTQRTEPR